MNHPEPEKKQAPEDVFGAERTGLKPVRIGSLEVKVPIALGPMAGITDQPFRLLCREQGAGLLYTEMVSAKAITYYNKNTKKLLEVSPSEKPVGVQLFGNDPETMAAAAEMIEGLPFDFFDVNMGCPVPKVVRNGEGSALMKDPERAGKIIAAMKKRVRKPVTAKIRSGFQPSRKNAVELAEVLEDSGADMIAVHGRTREQYYSGKADWDIIRRVKEAVRIPVIGNGDITDGISAEKMLEETGCDGIMIARAARGNPWIFRETAAYLTTGRAVERPSRDEVLDMILRHAKMLVECKGEFTGVREMRKQTAWYVSGMRNASLLRRRVNRAEHLEDLVRLVEELRESG